MLALAVLMALIFSSKLYLASLNGYYVLPDQQVRPFGAERANHLFVFSGSVAAGTILGGPVGDVGPK